jgi:uncharacterized protein (TIGR02646 family)
MIKIKKNFKDVPAKLSSQACLDKISATLTEKQNHEFDKEYYNKGCINELLKINQKCWFCDGDYSPGSYWEVEHFRPKKPPRGNRIKNFFGYYWLGYEWSNLLLSCRKCNGKKSTKFPIKDESKRILKPKLNSKNKIILKHSVADSNYLLNEKALLINPEIDNPYDYFIFKRNGEMESIDPEDRGKATISVCALNRDELILHRKGIIDTFFTDIKSTLKRHLEGEIDVNGLKAILDDKFFTLVRNAYDETIVFNRVWFFLYQKFDLFISNSFTSEDNNLLSIRFKKFKAKHNFL